MHEELNLSSLLFIVARRWHWILLSAVIGFVVFLLYSIYIITPKYSSSIELYVRNVPMTAVAGDGTIVQGDLSAAARLVDTYIVVLQNDEVKLQVVDALDNRISISQLDHCLSMAAVNETEILCISALTEDPDLSADICNVVAQIAPEVLKRVVKAGSVEVIAAAQPASSPSEPNIPRNSIMGALLGSLLSLSVVFLIFLLDSTVKGTEDLQKRTSIPILGEIPCLGNADKVARSFVKGEQKLAHRTHVVEAYKMVRANLLFSLTNTRNNVIAISSAEPNAGKSTTSANIGISMALTGAKVLIVDGDMRRPTMHKFFKIENKSGLSELLSNQITFESVVCRGVHLDTLDIVTAGQTPPNPSELLGTERMAYFLQVWSKEYDYVFVDTPPVTMVADSLMLTAKIAGIILIARQKQTHYHQLRKAVEALTHLDANVLGIVVSDVNWKHNPYYYGRYRYSNYLYNEKSYYYNIPGTSHNRSALIEVFTPDDPTPKQYGLPGALAEIHNK